ncbi:transcriptional regulator CysB [Agaricicola taiwanensis]|uniref:Transcriptional regulator CysB n=1 Tax=Agaricicola taiwanensis TaxID=591372 RepID=A0A8J2VX80_9RHOB|nr:LysR substrate-binding domain-containing protein [Agaricicola taiwanensis]GGE37968.1 transcriptional regulator CysB [Agaricicola taiwanensis]
MNLRSLESLCKVVDCGLSISDASDKLNRSQPTVSRQIQEIERDVGVKIFDRQRNRLLRLTREGEQIVEIARRLLRDQQSLQRIGEDARHGNIGELTVATTHTQACYSLPPVVRNFMANYPQVNLTLRQGDPVQCHELVAQGLADLAVCTEARDPPDGVIFIPCFRLNRSIVTQKDHPLTRTGGLTLEKVSKYPLITYGEAFSGRDAMERAFASKGLTPKVVMSAVDADVSKAYVGFGLGIAILATIAFDPARDTELKRLDARHIIPSSALGIVVPKASYLRQYMTDFIIGFAPHVTERRLRRILLDGKNIAVGDCPEI